MRLSRLSFPGLLALCAACGPAGGDSASELALGSRSRPEPCVAPSELEPPPLPLPGALARMPGTYDLTVVATQGGGPDTVARGRLVLEPTDSAHFRAATNPSFTQPLVGHSDVDLTRLGPVQLAYSPASRDADDPGVQAVYMAGSRDLRLMFGNAFNDRVMRLHQGVMFRVFALDSTGFRGTWSGDRGPPPVPAGYFCAERSRPGR